MHSAEEWSSKLFTAQAEDSARAARAIADIREGVSYEHYFVSFAENKVAVSKVV